MANDKPEKEFEMPVKVFLIYIAVSALIVWVNIEYKDTAYERALFVPLFAVGLSSFPMFVLFIISRIDKIFGVLMPEKKKPHVITMAGNQKSKNKSSFTT